MSILEVKDLEFKYTVDDLYSKVSFNLEQKDHAVLVGPNGIGKSTFMKIIAGILVPDKGTVKWENGVNYVYLDQYLEVKKDMTINEYIYGAYSNLFQEEEKMNEIYENLTTYSDMDKMLNRAESIREYLELNDFYNIETDISNVVVGLGLKRVDKTRMIKSLSGGEKMKVFLCKMLLEKPDFILMDEPTNFLDKEHVEWLINYLKSYKNGFLVISHDKEFLRGIAEVVYAIEAKQINKYKGNYDFYLKERELRQTKQLEDYTRQQEFIKKTQIFIEKNITRAKTTKRAQSRRKMLEKLELIDKPTKEYEPHINFPYTKDMGDYSLRIKNLLFGYDSPLLQEFSYKMGRDEKIEIIGKNGIGKSTFIKTIMKQIDSLGGSFEFSPSVSINYFSQEEDLDMNITPVDYIRIKYPLTELTDCMKTLAALGIRGDLARKRLSELSGGELSRTRIARMTLMKSNFLILDEPTNHLDQLTKNELKEAIIDFPGAVILVSHEKGFADDFIDTEVKF